MSTILGKIATLDRIERTSFFETLFASGKEGRANFLLILAQSDEASRAAFYEGMHGNAVQRWEDQRLALGPLDADAVRAAKQVVSEILEDVIRIAAEIADCGSDLSQFSEGEVQLLTALKRTINRGYEPDWERLAEFGAQHFHRFLVEWDQAFDQLSNKGLLKEIDGIYSLTPKGRVYANIANKERPVWLYLYNELYIRAEQSQAHGVFCEKVYGKDLCQLGQTDMEQIHALLEALEIGPGSCVLDLGCGNGMISEYISDQTQASVTGIDIADEAIERAQARTESKRDRLAFQIGNVNMLDDFPGTFEAIIALDTLHIAVDLVAALRQTVARLQPEGQMGVFWESWIQTGTPETHLRPDNTRLAQALRSLGLSYKIIDFTEANHRLWQKTRRVLEELRADFEAEGNLILYETALEETNRIDRGMGCRYLYIIRKNGAC
jgi:2-polyprenyl-3-methyl-5-hydroxy-6-metoxy-1,4-benzoquinol methylase